MEEYAQSWFKGRLILAGTLLQSTRPQRNPTAFLANLLRSIVPDWWNRRPISGKILQGISQFDPLQAKRSKHQLGQNKISFEGQGTTQISTRIHNGRTRNLSNCINETT